MLKICRKHNQYELRYILNMILTQDCLPLLTNISLPCEGVFSVRCLFVLQHNQRGKNLLHDQFTQRCTHMFSLH